jgi:predicted transcriptional regulator
MLLPSIVAVFEADAQPAQAPLARPGPGEALTFYQDSYSWGKVGAVLGLGDLEAAVMDVLWSSHTALKVREVCDRLATGKDLAYTTVMTVLDNLHKKQWVGRERFGKAYRYWPLLTRQEAAVRALRSVLDESGDPEAVLLHFTRSVSDRESRLLRKALRGGPGKK